MSEYLKKTGYARCAQDVSYGVSINDVIATTLRKTADQAEESSYKMADLRRWLPPDSAVRKLAEIVQQQIEYLITAGYHEAEMPDFLPST